MKAKYEKADQARYRCQKGHISWYDPEWDSHLCKKCDIWLEVGCGREKGDDCHFGCKNRPERPSGKPFPVKKEKKEEENES